MMTTELQIGKLGKKVEVLVVSELAINVIFRTAFHGKKQ